MYYKPLLFGSRVYYTKLDRLGARLAFEANLHVTGFQESAHDV